MIEKLKSNYNLSNILARVLFVLMFVFAQWKTGLMSTVVILGQSNLAVALASVALLGVALMFLLPIIVNFALNFAKLYSVPRAEYCLLAHVFCALGYFIYGLLNLISLFTPIMTIWGTVLYPVVSSLIAATLFYRTTSRLYFNNVTRVYYFKVCVIVYLALVLIWEVL